MAKKNVDEEAQILWAEPPAVTRGPQANPRYKGFADQLREYPGNWAIFKEGSKDSQNVTDINKGYMQAFTPAGDFQATSRRREDGEGFDIYARFIGEGFEGDEPEGE